MKLADIETWHASPKDAYKAEVEALRIRLGELQRRCHEREVPTILAFHGFSASGKGTMVAELLQALDPRQYTVHSIFEETDEEMLLPYLARHWARLPAHGRLAVFVRSWYSGGLSANREFRSKKRRDRLCQRINVFERQLADDGYLIIKFFVHVSKKEQKKRFERLRSKPETEWRVTKQDWKNHYRYEKNQDIVEQVVDQTDTPHAPWVVLPADNRRYAVLTMLRTIVEQTERHLAQMQADDSTKTSPPPVHVTNSSPLDQVDLSLALNRDTYERQLDALQQRLRLLQEQAFHMELPVAIVYEGWDAAGKGGNIRRLVRTLDPRGYDVVPIGAPNSWEQRHHYLWRFWTHVPPAGRFAIFDRSWYGRVLVENVEGLCTPEECERAYGEICEMEQEWTESGVVLLKFWLHISKDEQLRRFEERQSTPHKQWKITDEDWRNREKWDQYYEAVSSMILRTSTEHAPWTVVESNCKWHARVKVLFTVVRALEARI